jgi:hypothetical protein
VCVRVVQANGMDLSRFQFDQDLTWAVLFMNADGSVYGRFGTRDDRNAMRYLTLDGFRRAMEGALEVHRGYPGNRDALQGNLPPAPKFKTPENFPSLRGKFQPTLELGKNLRKSCMHCHQIHDAERKEYRTANQPMPDEALWRYPMPQTLGMVLDPRERATVRAVQPDSPAQRGGLQVKDVIVKLEGQPVISVADVQWILDRAGAKQGLKAEVKRGDRRVELKLPLPEGWRRKGDFGWRTSTWDLRRMATGGLLLEEMTAAERKKAGLGEDGLALRVKHVGQFGEHAAAMKAGFRKDDILIEVDSRGQRMSEAEFIAYGVQQKRAGDRVAVTVQRGGKQVKLQLPMQ